MLCYAVFGLETCRQLYSMGAIDELSDGRQTFARRTHSQLSLGGICLACVPILRNALNVKAGQSLL